ncbi:MAG: DNA polymerase thumb domain-containing protein [Janthinobacterium lividum]
MINLPKVERLNWLYINMNSYFATIEQQLDRMLRGKPIAVVANLSNSTSAIAVSYEAKKLGISTGTKIFEAKRICPELVCVVSKHEEYTKYHKAIFAEVEKHIHVDKILSIDEGACRLTGELCNKDNAINIAKLIKQSIRDNVGECIECSIGIAPNRYLAKIASNIQKPNGLVIIRPEDIPGKLLGLHLNDLPGVGNSTYNRLQGYGIQTIGQLYQYSQQELKKKWGSIVGAKIWYLLRGYDLSNENTASNTIGHSQVLAPNSRNVESARVVALSLLQKAAYRLRAKELHTSRIILTIQATDKQILKKSIKVTTLSDNVSLSKILTQGWNDLINSYIANNKQLLPYKISIALTGLTADSIQLSFGDMIESKQKQRNTSLTECLDKINNKYGNNTVVLGCTTSKYN